MAVSVGKNGKLTIGDSPVEATIVNIGLQVKSGETWISRYFKTLGDKAKCDQTQIHDGNKWVNITSVDNQLKEQMDAMVAFSNAAKKTGVSVSDATKALNAFDSALEKRPMVSRKVLPELTTRLRRIILD